MNPLIDFSGSAIMLVGALLMVAALRWGTKDPDRADWVRLSGLLLLLGGLFVGDALDYFETKGRVAESVAQLRAVAPSLAAQGEAAELVSAAENVGDRAAMLDMTRLMFSAVLFGLALGMLVAHALMTRRSSRSPVGVTS